MSSGLILTPPSEASPLWRALMAWPDNPGKALLRAIEASAIGEVVYEAPVLDIGCGDGAFAALLQPWPDVGIDQDGRRCRLAAATTRYRHVLQGDASRIPIRAGSFATVICNSVLEHADDWRVPLREMYRVLSPGGRLIVNVPTLRKRDWLFFRRSEIYGNARPRNEYPTYFDERWSHRRYVSVDRCAQEVEAEGFRIDYVAQYLPLVVAELVDLLLSVRVRPVDWLAQEAIQADGVLLRVLYTALWPYFEMGCIRQVEGACAIVSARRVG